MCLRAELGARVAGKTVLKMMGEVGPSCAIRRPRAARAYSPCRGESGGGFEDLLRRGFGADAPFRKAGTDVTELGQPWGKAYLAPVVGFAAREALARDVSESPDLARQEGVLSMLWEALPAGPGMVPASDRGWQHRRPRYAAALRGHGVRQPMSRKGNCPDSAATEQFFGHLKDEFSRGRAWPDFESFKGDLDAYIRHWNERRRTGRLKGLTPAEWRRQALGG